jgi:hypothetical protein
MGCGWRSTVELQGFLRKSIQFYPGRPGNKLGWKALHKRFCRDVLCYWADADGGTDRNTDIDTNPDGDAYDGTDPRPRHADVDADADSNGYAIPDVDSYAYVDDHTYGNSDRDTYRSTNMDSSGDIYAGEYSYFATWGVGGYGMEVSQRRVRRLDVAV